MSKVINKSVTIEPITLTASEWQLYADHKSVNPHWEDCWSGARWVWDYVVDVNGPKSIQSAACAITMNRTFTRAVNEGLNVREVFELVQEVARDFKSGGTDTEPRNVLHDLLEDVFGVDAVRAYC
jgi:hypothetical protein